jgi:regulator of sigma E protease
MLFTIASFVVLLLTLIFVHELGHFLAAKLLGVRVLKFSLGFPPKAISKKFGDTEYQLSWLPLGGYVSLFGEVPGEEIAPEERKFSFSHKPLWVRAIIVFAGPFFNVVFAVLALWLVNFAVGIQHLPPVIGLTDPGDPAFATKFEVGDRVLTIDQEPIKYFSQIEDKIDQSVGAPLTFTVDRDGRVLEFTETPKLVETTGILGDPISVWRLGLKPNVPPIIGEVLADKPAAAAGLAPGDRIVSVDGSPIREWSDLTLYLKESDKTTEVDGKLVHQKPADMTFEIERAGKILNIVATPVLDATIGLDGNTGFVPVLGVKPRQEILREPLGVFGSLTSGFSETWKITDLTVRVFIQLFKTNISVKILGGPIMIAEVAGSKARDGLWDFIWVMALVSVNLAIINLVPLPILDGGQLLFFLIEGLRRRPLSLRFREACQWVGVTAMVALMVLVFYNDIHRWVTRVSGPSYTQEEISK